MSTLSNAVRTARLEDAAGIAQVHDLSWRAAYRGLIPGLELEKLVERRGPAWWERALSQKASILVQEHHGRIVGYATTGKNRSRRIEASGEIYEIYLRPDYQGIGFGRQLFQTARKTLAGQGHRSALVWVLSENEQAVSFYEAMGGNQAGAGIERFGSVDVAKTAYRWLA